MFYVAATGGGPRDGRVVVEGEDWIKVPGDVLLAAFQIRAEYEGRRGSPGAVTGVVVAQTGRELDMWWNARHLGRVATGTGLVTPVSVTAY